LKKTLTITGFFTAYIGRNPIKSNEILKISPHAFSILHQRHIFCLLIVGFEVKRHGLKNNRFGNDFMIILKLLRYAF